MELTDSQKAQLQKIARKHRLKFIIAFGSEVTKNTHPSSDLDIAVLSHKNDISFRDFTEISSALEKIGSSHNVE